MGYIASVVADFDTIVCIVTLSWNDPFQYSALLTTLLASNPLHTPLFHTANMHATYLYTANRHAAHMNTNQMHTLLP